MPLMSRAAIGIGNQAAKAGDIGVLRLGGSLVLLIGVLRSGRGLEIGGSLRRYRIFLKFFCGCTLVTGERD